MPRRLFSNGHAGYGQVPLDDYLDDDDNFASSIPSGHLHVDGISNTEAHDQTAYQTHNIWMQVSRRFNCNNDCRCTCSFSRAFKSLKRKETLYALFSVLTLLVVPSVCVGLGYHFIIHKKPLVIDKSIRSFSIPNHKVSKDYNAFLAASSENQTFNFNFFERALLAVNQKIRQSQNMNNSSKSIKKATSSSSYISHVKRRSLKENKTQYQNFEKKESLDFIYQIIPRWKMQVVFIVKDGGNIFQREYLEYIHKVEKDIMLHPHFSEFCLKDYNLANIDPLLSHFNNCAPLNSLLTYFYPSGDLKTRPIYDGLGDTLIDIETGLRKAFSSRNSYYFVDPKMDKYSKNSSLLRTEVEFGSPLKGKLNDKDEAKKFTDFVVTYTEKLSKASTDKIQVLYGGSQIFDYEVEHTFWSDVKLAIITLGCICLIMLVLIASPWLTLWGILSIILAFPMALIFYTIVFKNETLGIMNGVAAFVIIGIGVDDVFVFVNIFRQAGGHMKMPERIVHTIKVAGRATFFTSFTTAAAFGANMISSIPAVNKFGLFMSLIVACCWFSVMVLMPSALCIWILAVKKCEDAVVKLFKRKCKGHESSSCKARSLKLPEDIDRFVKGKKPRIFLQDMESSSPPNQSMSAPDLKTDVDDNDVPLILMEDPMEQYLNANYSDDDLLINVMDENLEETSGSLLQKLVFHTIAKPVIKTRYIIIVVSIIFFGVSMGLTTQLHPSSGTLQFFKEDTNLQQLLNLKNKLPVDTTSCFGCSAVYNKDTSPIIPQRTFPPPLIPLPTTRVNVTTSSSRPHLHVYTTPKKLTLPPLPTKSFVNASTTFPISTTATDEPCPDCNSVTDPPLIETGVIVHVVFGIKGYHQDKASLNHVVSESLGDAVFDENFENIFSSQQFNTTKFLAGLTSLCRICRTLANSKLVKPGTAYCFPDIYLLVKVLEKIPECKGLNERPESLNRPPANFVGGTSQNAILWWAFGFESTTSKSDSYTVAYKDYLQWESLMQDIRQTEGDKAPEHLLDYMFQTSDHWKQVLMEVIAVRSAIYGLVLSMVICVISLAIFTGHFLLLLIVVISIVEMIFLVVAIFYLVGWEIGAVEAISLSILVGSSVDYCVHLVEGYVLAGDLMPKEFFQDAGKARRWRTKATLSHIGVAVFCSALTTIIASIPLTQTVILPFAKFGNIVAINTTVCIFYTFTICSALLATIAPGHFVASWKSYLKTFVGTILTAGIAVAILFVINKSGTTVPGPNGGSLFPA